jgi:hypothetical protein
MRHAGTLALVIGAAAMFGCGDGTLIFGGDFDDKPASVTVGGDVKDQTPANATRDVVVFTFTDLTAEALDAGPPYEKYPRMDDGSLDPNAPANFKDQESRLLDNAGTFKIPDVESGSITIMFLLDEPQPDGQIDAGDDYAIFSDSDRDLNSVKGGRTVNVPEIEILYDSDLDGGIATTSKKITKTIEPDDDDN